MGTEHCTYIPSQNSTSSKIVISIECNRLNNGLRGPIKYFHGVANEGSVRRVDLKKYKKKINRP